MKEMSSREGDRDRLIERIERQQKDLIATVDWQLTAIAASLPAEIDKGLKDPKWIKVLHLAFTGVQYRPPEQSAIENTQGFTLLDAACRERNVGFHVNTGWKEEAGLNRPYVSATIVVDAPYSSGELPVSN